jgi:two-component system sensor histidine kinase ResE
MARFDLAELASRELERAARGLPADVTFSYSGPRAGTDVTGDERRLSEVLRNLLANAARHTSQGSIEMRLEGEADQYRVSVIDSGEGIPEQDLPYVFERFYRADAARAAHTGGAGLGLAIARRIVRDHGGDVFAGPTPGGGGATVGFTLPRNAPTAD